MQDLIDESDGRRRQALHLRALRDWCRLAGAGTVYEPGSPWENPFVEAFNGRVHDELLNVEEFSTLFEAHVIVEA